ncbi:MAG: ABC transporter ATP-binding protein/permease [Flavobacteriales bacterium]|nr:ABC transporter ATP-binding protein/permease [Flavobacteriales bacterium]
MQRLFQILKFALNYKGVTLLNILFNILSVIFSILSIGTFIPLLDLIIIKDTDDYAKILEQGAPILEFSPQYLLNKINYELAVKLTEDPDLGKLNALLFLCIIIFVLFTLKNLFRYLAMYFVAVLRNGIMRDLRNQLFSKLTKLHVNFFNNERKGDIISKMSNDVQDIEWSVLTSIEMVFRDPIAIVFYMSAIIFLSPKLTIFVLILLPVAGLLIGSVGKSLRKTSEKGQQVLGVVISHIEEAISGLRIIKAFNAEEKIRERFYKTNEEYKTLMTSMYRKRDLASPMSEFLSVIVMLTITWFGGKLIIESNGQEGLTGSEFLVYIGLFSQIIPHAKSLTTAYLNMQKGAASAKRIDEILNVENQVKEPEKPETFQAFKNRVTYENVDFEYVEGQTVLKDVSFEIEKGQTVALVGASGGGKSTIADLLPRFFDPTSGAIKVDGVDIRRLPVKALRSLFGIVTQQSILFNDSVKNNIAFGMSGVPDEAIVKAAKIANAHEFIVDLSDQYNTNIGDQGTKLSGGQKQRLSIARAVLNDPEILILDEATSALDTESERLVQEALDKLMENRTTLVIAHRLSTVQNAHKILVVDKGRIIESGTHSELYELKGTYRNLCDLQSLS